MDRLLLTPWLRPILLPLKRGFDYLAWIRRGRHLPLPSGRKRAIIRDYGRRWNAHTLVETGTYMGETVNALQSCFESIYSIELNPDLHRAAAVRFRRQAHIKLLNGDSGQVLPLLLPDLDGAVLFWLDGHYSGGITSGRDVPTPIEAELESIFATDALQPIVLIDDARLFVGSGGYPSVEQLKARAAQIAPSYRVDVDNDMIALTPTGIR
jgi:hypothetical protein